MDKTIQTINDRVEKLMNIENLNINAFALALGYKNNTTIYDIIKGKLIKGTDQRKKTKPGRIILEKICNRFGVRYEWLVEGKEPMFESQDRNLKSLDIKLIELPFIDFYASASFRNDSGVGLDRIAQKKKKIIKFEEDEYYEGTILIQTMGDSMEPSLNSGSTLLGRIVEKENWKYVGNAIYAVFFAGRYEVKRIVENNFADGYLMLIADNPEHGKQKVNIQDITDILKIEEIVRSKVF